MWVGTSLSKALDTNKFKKDLDVELRMAKAFCIEEEGKFPKANFKAIVPEAAKDADTLVLQTGSLEITNIDVNKAMMCTNKEIGVYKKEWFDKVESSSLSLFKLAEECVAADPNLNVVIVKRPKRFDRSSRDILGIKAKLSEFGNKIYDQLLMKSNHSDRIHLIELNLLQNSHSNYLKSIIYGTHDDPRFDGIHFFGSEKSRHFTYRAIQSMSSIIRKAKTLSSSRNELISPGGGTNGRHLNQNDYVQTKNHKRNQSAGNQQSERSENLYSDVLKNAHPDYCCPPPQVSDYLKDRDIRNKNNNKSGYCYTVPTSNRFSDLNQENC